MLFCTFENGQAFWNFRIMKIGELEVLVLRVERDGQLDNARDPLAVAHLLSQVSISHTQTFRKLARSIKQEYF